MAEVKSKKSAVKKTGNWYEEDILEKETGVRYAPDPKNRALQLLTGPRCIIHTERTEPKDYKSCMQREIIDLKTHPQYKTLIEYKFEGPRSLYNEQKKKSQVEADYKKSREENNIELRKVDYETVMKGSYSRPGFKPSLELNKTDGRVDTKGNNFTTDPAISFYSDVVMNGTGNNSTPNFQGTFCGNLQNPFRKNSAFSADPTIDLIARKCESNERPRALPSYLGFRSLQSFRKRLLGHVQFMLKESTQKVSPGLANRLIINNFWMLADKLENARVPMSDLIECFNVTLDFQIFSQESEALLCAFDTDNSNSILIPEIVSFFRGVVSGRRLELIGYVYDSLCDTGLDQIVKSTILSKYIEISPGNMESLLEALGISNPNLPEDYPISYEDFEQFYLSISVETDDDYEFETILKKSWKI